jgi:hypothetical protein
MTERAPNERDPHDEQAAPARSRLALNWRLDPATGKPAARWAVGQSEPTAGFDIGAVATEDAWRRRQANRLEEFAVEQRRGPILVGVVAVIMATMCVGYLLADDAASQNLVLAGGGALGVVLLVVVQLCFEIPRATRSI